MTPGALRIFDDKKTTKYRMTHICNRDINGALDSSKGLCATPRQTDRIVRVGMMDEVDCVVCADLVEEAWGR